MMNSNWRRGFLRLIASVLLASSVSTGNAGAASSTATILLDGYPLPFPAAPQIVNGHTLVPFRAIAEALQIQVEWDGATQTIRATKGNGKRHKEVYLQLDNPVAMVDGQPVPLPLSPREENGHTLVPLSFFSRQFGAQVSWDGKTRTVSIASPQEDLYTMAFYAISSFGERDFIPRFDAVAFGWSRIDAHGELTLEGRDFYWPQPAGEITPERIVQDAQAAGTAPYLMVFAADGGGELSRLLADEALRKKAVANIAALAQEKQFAGVALDFEGLGLNGDLFQVQQQYTRFVRELAEILRAQRQSVSVVVHPLNGAYRGYDYKELGEAADDVVVMAYAYEDEQQPEPLVKVDEAIRLALQQVPKEKLILGISMGSEHAQSVNSKVGLAKRYGLKGVAIWRLGLIGEPAFHQLTQSITWK